MQSVCFTHTWYLIVELGFISLQGWSSKETTFYTDIGRSNIPYRWSCMVLFFGIVTLDSNKLVSSLDLESNSKVGCVLAWIRNKRMVNDTYNYGAGNQIGWFPLQPIILCHHSRKMFHLEEDMWMGLAAALILGQLQVEGYMTILPVCYCFTKIALYDFSVPSMCTADLDHSWPC